MKKVIFLSTAVFFTGCVHSDSAVVVTGVVVDKNGVPVPNAKVEISHASVETDANGYFCYDRMHPKTKIKIKVTSLNHNVFDKEFSYDNYRLKIRLFDENEKGDGVLEIESLGLEVSSYNFCQGF